MNEKILFLEEIQAEIKRRRPLRLFMTLYHNALGRKNLREVVRNGLRLKLIYAFREKKVIRWGIGIYERAQIRYLFTQAQTRKCKVFLDIGANIGHYSLVAVKTELFEQIHAIEPSAGNFERLQWHIQENGFSDKVQIHQKAVTDSCGKIRISEENADDCRFVKVINSDAEGVEVDCVTLDSLFDFRGQSLAIKMDIEGHEISALRGAKRLFSENDIFLQMEILEHNPETMDYILAEGFELIHRCDADFYFTKKKTQ